MTTDVSSLWSPYFDVSSDCVKVLNTSGEILLANPIALGIMGFDSPPPGILWPDGLTARSRTEAHQALHTADRGSTARFYGSSTSPEGDTRQWSTLMTPIQFDGATRVLSVSREMTSELQAFSSLLYRSGTDELTGVRSRRAIIEELEKLRRCADHSRTGLAILMVDVDGLKQVNDYYGHIAGDAVIRSVALRLRVLAEATQGAVGRMGGDEFVLGFLGGYSRDGLSRLCSRILELTDKPVAIPDGATRSHVQVSFTVGATIYPTGGADVSTVVARADHALIEQKRLRRGQARLAM